MHSPHHPPIRSRQQMQIETMRGIISIRKKKVFMEKEEKWPRATSRCGLLMFRGKKKETILVHCQVAITVNGTAEAKKKRAKDFNEERSPTHIFVARLSTTRGKQLALFPSSGSMVLAANHTLCHVAVFRFRGVWYQRSTLQTTAFRSRQSDPIEI